MTSLTRAVERTPWQFCRNVGGDDIPGMSCVQIVDASTEERDGRRIEVLHVERPKATIHPSNLAITDNQLIPAEAPGQISIGRCTRGGLCVVRVTAMAQLDPDDVFGASVASFVAVEDGEGLTFHGWVNEDARLAYASFAGGDGGFDRCQARTVTEVDEDDATFVVDTVIATRGTSPLDHPLDNAEIMQVVNAFGWGAEERALVYIQWHERPTNGLHWHAYQVECP